MNYKEVIEAKYNREAWQQLLHDIFLNKAQFYNSTSEVKVNSRPAKSALSEEFLFPMESHLVSTK